MRTIVLLLIYIFLTILLIPVLLFCYPIKFAQPIILIGKWALWAGPKILGIRLDASGIERIDKRMSYVFMANHLSLIDGPLLFMLIPQFVRVLLKKEAFRIPIIGLAMRQVDFVSVDRKGLKGGKKSIDRATRMIKEKGFSFLIFPEGTRSRDGKLQPFKRGGFFLAVNSQVPIFPVSIKGTYALMPKGSFFAKKGKVRVIFHSPVSVEGFDESNLSRLIGKVRNVIQSGLD
ncbi:MAG: 1-acyl-sn-glycerol-3-phosphate acyltransferase [Candidatus Aminicenantes bacterium]|nr:1-acyl-sn-glycerol-3-phosphate acyltransferase [Candidatus Aminicenantes bacterium]